MRFADLSDADLVAADLPDLKKRTIQVPSVLSLGNVLTN